MFDIVVIGAGVVCGLVARELSGYQLFRTPIEAFLFKITEKKRKAK